MLTNSFRTGRRAFGNKVLIKGAVSHRIVEANYAVRGKLPLMGEEIKEKIRQGEGKFPFQKVTPLNIGNP